MDDRHNDAYLAIGSLVIKTVFWACVVGGFVTALLWAFG